MAYGLKYTQWVGQGGSRVLIRVYVKDWTGASYGMAHITGASLQLIGGQSDVLSPVLKTSFSWSLADCWDEGTTKADGTTCVNAAGEKCGKWEEFYTNDATKYKVELSVLPDGGSACVIWTGFVTPDSWAENLIYRGSITVTARDMLGALRDKEFDLTGRVSVLDIVQGALSACQSPMALSYTAGHFLVNSDGSSILSHTFAASTFAGDSWQTTLEEVLESLGLVLRYNGVNGLVLTSLRYIKADTLRGTHGAEFTGRSGLRQLDPAIKEIVEVFDVDLVELACPDPAASQYAATGSNLTQKVVAHLAGGGTQTSTNYIPGYTLTQSGGEGWSGTLAAPALGTIVDGAADRGIYFPTDIEESVAATQELPRMRGGFVFKIEQDGGLVELGTRTGIGTIIRPCTSGHAISEIRIRVEVVEGGTTKYLTADGSWTTTSTTFPVEIGQEVIVPEYNGIGAKVVIEKVVTENTMPAYFAILAALKLAVSPSAEGASIISEYKTTTIYNEANNVTIKRDPKVGSANYGGCVDFVQNVLALGDAVAPDEWNWPGASSYLPLAVMIQAQILCYHAAAASLFTGTMHDTTGGTASALPGYGISYYTRDCVPVSGTYDFVSGFVGQVALREVYSWESVWGQSFDPQYTQESGSGSGSTSATGASGASINPGSGSSGGGGATGSAYFQLNGTLGDLVELRDQYAYLGPRGGLFFDGATLSGTPVPDLYVDVIEDSQGNDVRVLRTPLALVTGGDQSVGDGTPGGGGGGAGWLYDLGDVYGTTAVLRADGTEKQVGDVLQYYDSTKGWVAVAASSIGRIYSAGTGLSISNSNVIGIASGYKLPTTTEWGNKADASALGNYLPLSAGSSKPLTGALYVGGAFGDKINLTSTSSTQTWCNIIYTPYSAARWSVGAGNGNTFYWWNSSANTQVAYLDKDGYFHSAGYKVGSSTGFLKADGSIDTNTYLIGNQTITLSGDVSGSGTTAITVSIGAGKVTKAMLATAVQTSLGLADTALQSSDVTALTLKMSRAGTTDASIGTYNPLSGSATTLTISSSNIYDAIGTTKYHPFGGDATDTDGLEFKIGGVKFIYHKAVANSTPAYLELNCALLTQGDQIVGSGTPGSGGGGGASYLYELQDFQASQSKATTTGTMLMYQSTGIKDRTGATGAWKYASPSDVATAIGLGNYLPLSAGSSKALTGALYVGGNFGDKVVIQTASGGDAWCNVIYQPSSGKNWSVGAGADTFYWYVYGSDVTAGTVTSISRSGDISANSFVKKNGTSSQFLMADGSVNNNTYLTTSSAASTYLAVSGNATATISRSAYSVLNINNTTASASQMYVDLQLEGVSKGSFGVAGTGAVYIYNYTSNVSMGVNTSGNPYFNNGTISYTILHANNYTSYTPILNSSSTHATSSSVIYAPSTAGTSGYLLKSNGSGEPSWTAQSNITAGALTTVSKTAWGKTYWTASGVPDSISGDMSSVGNISFSASGKNIGGLLYFDTTNSRIGLGAAPGTAKLDISAGSYGVGVKISTTTSYSCVQYYSNSSTTHNWTVGSSVSRGTGYDDFYFYNTYLNSESGGRAGYITKEGDLVMTRRGTFNGVVNITGTASYAEGIRIHALSGVSSIWFGAVNDTGYDAGMWGITVNSDGMRFRGPASTTATTVNDYMIIAHGGNVGIGTPSPSYKLDINSGSVGDAIRLTSTTTYSCIIYTPSGSGKNWSVGANNSGQFYFYTNSASRAYFTQAGTLVTTGDQTISSDINLKDNLKDITLTSEQIANAPAVSFDWKDGHGHSFGSIAQYWKPLVPEAVLGEEGNYTLAYGQLGAVLGVNNGKAIFKLEQHETEQDKEIKKLKKRVLELEEEVERLRN